MAIFNAAQLLATALAPNLPTDVGGRARFDRFTYTFAGTEATNDVINLAKLPLGARVYELIVYNEDLGTTVTIDVGDATTPNRYFNDIAGGTAGAPSVYWDGAGEVSVLIDTEAKRTIQALLAAVTTPTAGAVLSGRVLYVID